MKVLVFGSLNIDLVFHVPHIVRPGETIQSVSPERSAGGKGANQAAALAKAGLPVFLAGKIGEDGLFLLELLRSYGVNTSLVRVSDGETGKAIIQVDEAGQNAIVLHAGGNGEITREEIDGVLSSFENGDTLVLQNEVVRNGEIMEKAAARGLSICLNPSPYDAAIEELPLSLVDIFFLNELEGAALAGRAAGAEEALGVLAEKFPGSEIVLTCGEAGAFYARGKERAWEAAVKTTVVDTTGAGDTFSGYFLAARLRGESAEASLALASRAAALAVSRPGAMSAIPFAGELAEVPA